MMPESTSPQTGLIQVMQDKLELSEFEKTWTKRLRSSQTKTREWLFRHAVDVYAFKLECKKHEFELPHAPAVYFTQACGAWLGYSDTAASQWAKAGELISSIDASDGKSIFTSKDDLPASMSTLYQLSTLNEDQLIKAKEVGLISPDVTRDDIIDFKRKAKPKAGTKPKVNPSLGKEIEQRAAELLNWRYDNSVLEDYIELLEEQTDSTQVEFDTHICVRVKDLWSCSPKVVPPTWEAALIKLGIDCKKQTIKSWALEALVANASENERIDKATLIELIEVLKQ